MATKITTIDDARAKYASVDGELAQIDQDLSDIADHLGRALAGMRMGDKKAEARAGELSLKRAELTRKRTDVELTRSALEEAIARMEAEDAANERIAVLAAWEQVNAEARDLEARFADQITAAGETAKQLLAASAEWSRLRVLVARMGEDAGTHRVPANPTGLIRPDVAMEPAREVTLWKRRYIDPSLPVPPRPLSSSELERRRGQKLIAEQRAREREQVGDDGTSFTLFARQMIRGGAA